MTRKFKKSTRILSLVLCLVMALSIVAISASAQENDETSRITATPEVVDFGKDYKKVETITVTNISDENVTLNPPVSPLNRFTIGALDKTELAPDEVAHFTLQPIKATRPVPYDDTIVVSTVQGDSITVLAKYTGEDFPSNTGWYKDKDDDWVYWDAQKSAYVTGWQELTWSGGKNWFYFSTTNCKMQTGWKNDIPGWEGTYFYFDKSNGTMQTGWKNNIPGWEGKWFYFNGNGTMQVKPANIDGKLYMFNEDGTLFIGWYSLDNPYKEGKIWSYSSENGFVSGWQNNIPGYVGQWFYFYETGAERNTMATGWLDYNGSRYYLSPNNGVMVTGFQNIDGVNYYFDANGKLLAE